MRRSDGRNRCSCCLLTADRMCPRLSVTESERRSQAALCAASREGSRIWETLCLVFMRVTSSKTVLLWARGHQGGEYSTSYGRPACTDAASLKGFNPAFDSLMESRVLLWMYIRWRCSLRCTKNVIMADVILGLALQTSLRHFH